MKEIVFYLCGIFTCMIVWFLWAVIASKKAKEAPLKEYARIHIDIEKAIRENGYLHYLAERWRIRMYSKCQKCGRKLTDPESIERGYGPECWGSILPHYSIEQGEPEESIPGQMTIEDFLGGLKDGGEKDMS